MIVIYVQKTRAKSCTDAPITSGSIGLRARFQFSEEWNKLNKIAIFETDNYKEPVEVPESGEVIVPDSVLVYPWTQLRVGVRGESEDGDVVIPTVYADCGTISLGANTTPVGTPPTPSQAEYLQAQIDELRESGVGGGIAKETDPTVPAWAKAATKPSYTAQEVGALPVGTVIPSIDTTLTQPGKAADAKAVGDALKSVSTAAPVTSVNGQTGDVQLTAENVGAIPMETLEEMFAYLQPSFPVIINEMLGGEYRLSNVTFEEILAQEESGFTPRFMLFPPDTNATDDGYSLRCDGRILSSQGFNANKRFIVDFHRDGKRIVLRISVDGVEEVDVTSSGGGLEASDVFENAEVAKFTNIFDTVEIEYGKILNTDGTASDTTAALATTGFIPVVGGDIIRMKDFAVYSGGSSRVVIYDTAHNFVQLVNHGNITESGYYIKSLAKDANGHHTEVEFLRPSGGGYIRICTNTAVIGENPVLTINEEIKYEMGYGTKLRKDVMVDYSQITNAPEKNCWSILPDQRINIAYSSIGRKPINTVEHFVDAATNFGYNALKADVRPTADGELVCCHDAGFTFDANGYITAYNSANATMIRDVTAETCLSYSFATGEHPCLVGDYLEICRGHGKIAFVTIRNEYMDVVIPKLLEELRAHNMIYSTIVNCMTYNSLVEWRKVDADVMINFTLGYGANIDTEAIDKAAALGYCSLCGFGVNSSGTAPIITCDFGYAREKGVRLLQAIAYAEGTPEECYALGYDGCQIGYPWNPVLIGSGGADWEASEGEPGHVLHRTHYTEVVTGTVLAETDMVFSGDGVFYTADPVAPVFAGEQYTVNWNGVEYRCVCKEIDDGDGTMLPAMGNLAAMEAGDDTGDPFLILVTPADVQVDFALAAFPLDGTTELTLSITGKTESVTRLPKKYLPELRGQKKIVITRGTSGNFADVSYDDVLKMDAAEFAASAVVLWKDCEFDVVSATKTPEADGKNELIRFAYISHGGENGAARVLHFGQWRKGGINFDRDEFPPYGLIQPPKGKVGQYLRVSAVDGSRNVTAVEAVDAPYTKAEIDAIMGSYITDIDNLVGGDA